MKRKQKLWITAISTLFAIQFVCVLSVYAFGFNMGFNFGGGQSARYENIESYLVWSPTSNDYGSKNTGTNTDYEFTLNGTEAEEISLSVTGTGYSLLSTTCGSNPFNLLTGNCKAMVRFTPTSAGTLPGSLIASWTNQSDVVASLTGVGVATGASDDFNGVDGTALATHDANWMAVSGGPFDGIGQLTINTNSVQCAGWMRVGAYYNSSSSDISQITVLANQEAYAAVRMSSTTPGYNAYMKSPSGGNWTAIDVYKNRTDYIGTIDITISQAAAHTLKITASGTSTVTLNVYVDGSLVGTRTDTTDTLTSGHSGFMINNSSSGTAVIAVGDWRNY